MRPKGYRAYRASLALLWVICFALAVLGTQYLRWIVGIGPDSYSKLFDLVIAQYAPYVGAILGFHFAAKVSAPAATKAQAIPYRLAMAMSGLWNLVMVGFVMRACMDSDLTTDAINDIRAVVPKLSWVVAPTIGFFFGKPAASNK